MALASLSFAILILSPYPDVTERIVSELQSVFALQSPFIEIELRMGNLCQKNPFCSAVFGMYTSQECGGPSIYKMHG